ncbi:CEI_1a_G0039280.mRNA.1.CDS.1 [Saccharomyces cerevisiae]|nr:EM14S01-3B_G0021430.mRNA.1.CDS.1 [Saccharomyces cerevisiae]CAI4613984.1 AMH_1a_G0039380.mRNA.1.CDS.1 [Saccharomyces cerevisiae]CAI4617084.1 CEI_1a_G0039280.mRNA.1.CDS.1 [Saccharomyces cerevisiae]CAI6783635.1 AMH_1a_G0039380.mRNA.1.CDS.1 [Saccharomyces cerevisiae]CAI7395927.1 CEI_1a_G0039280.mRNA.1.CDS.1 [Saccharomyces cerevisiae]
MAKKKSKSRSKSSRRVLDALQLAEREINGEFDNTSDNDKRHDARRNGTVVNLLKRSKGDTNSDEDGIDSESFEDEELNSDEALGSDDDYDILNSKFSQTIRDKKENANYEEEEDEGGYTSIDEEDLMPLSQVWDMDGKTAQSNGNDDEDASPQLKLQDTDISSESSSFEESESESEDDEEEEDPFDEISEDEEDIELNTITSKLIDETKSKAPKRLDTYGSGEANEYVLPSANAASGTSGKLSLADMMNVIDDRQVIENANLLKGKSSTYEVPLPQRIQQRHDRKAAYEISKQEVSKWNDIVQQNRRADHLIFPLNKPTEHNHASAFTRTQDVPQTELQEKVDQVLQESNLANPEKDSKFEELSTAKMTPEEMRKRTTEMRLMRELMFREERKARRLKKIKSKTYRKIKKKELMKNRELAAVSSDEDNEDHDIARAKERMTLKHKTNSKWAKDMIKHGMTNDAETREEMEEMLRQGERLKAKMLDRNSDDEEDGRVQTLSDVEDEEKENIYSEVLKSKLGKTGVMNMAFMKNGEAREREANKETLRQLRAVENGDDIKLFESDEEETNGENIQINKGRRIYTPGSLESNKDMNELNDHTRKEHKVDESRSLENRLRAKNSGQSKNARTNAEGAIIVEEESDGEPPQDGQNIQHDEEAKNVNPWLANESDEEHTVKKQSSKVNIIDKDSSKNVKAMNKMDKAELKQKKKKKGKSNDDEDLLLTADDSTRLKIVDPYGGSDNEQGDNVFMFKQQDVIAEAFAGDDVVAEFQEEKKRVIDDEDDKEVDTTLPGWGEWAGAGSKPKHKKRKFIKKVKGVVNKDKRRDKNLQNVIINEKVNKKNLKYQSSAVPFPFENREQYERSLRMPIGQEWTSRASHQELIKPRIMTKPGQVIDPLKAPFK